MPTEPFIGEIMLFGGNFAPRGWALCDGRLLPIAQYDALFALIGTIYGGDGQTTFAVPDLRSRIPVHQGNLAGGQSYIIGQTGGLESVTLTQNQLAIHSHPAMCNSANGTTNNPAGNFWAATPAYNQYTNLTPNTALNPNAVSPSGGNQPHDNMVPYLAVNYVISLEGIFPSRN